MKILEAGHKYQLDSIDGELLITLTFLKREGVKYPFNKGAHPGTNVQEVLRALIDRTRYLLAQVPCMETEQALHNLESALGWYEVRAARNHGRTLELWSAQNLSSLPTCPVCGHIQCSQHGPPEETRKPPENLELPVYDNRKATEATNFMERPNLLKG
jgi:hypothetical protein